MKLFLASAATLGLITNSGGAIVTVSDIGAGEVLEGTVRATDGDSLRMGDKRIRLFGIDAPESAQKCRLQGEEWACGRASRKALERLTDGLRATCQVRDMDRGRYVATCFADGVELNDRMVRRGWAVAYTQYSLRYVPAEIEARQAGLALWRSEFERPHEWRARKRAERAAAQTPQVPPSTDCLIKGNISRSGNRIYHSPGQADYARTRITEAQGERWFCTSEAAEAAGWRAALR